MTANDGQFINPKRNVNISENDLTIGGRGNVRERTFREMNGKGNSDTGSRRKIVTFEFRFFPEIRVYFYFEPNSAVTSKRFLYVYIYIYRYSTYDLFEFLKKTLPRKVDVNLLSLLRQKTQIFIWTSFSAILFVSNKHFERLCRVVINNVIDLSALSKIKHTKHEKSVIDIFVSAATKIKRRNEHATEAAPIAAAITKTICLKRVSDNCNESSRYKDRHFVNKAILIHFVYRHS